MTHVFKENLKNTTSLLINETRDTLHTTTTRETTNSRLSDSLDVITKNLPVALCATLSKTFPTLDNDTNVRTSRV